MKPSDMSVNKSSFSQPGRFAALANEDVKIGRLRRWMLERDLTWHMTKYQIRQVLWRLCFRIGRQGTAHIRYQKICRALGLGR